ncbi:UNVERIFIED_CONTAM: hypothetical protein FKN15_023714 [Acipenser sinensis]
MSPASTAELYVLLGAPGLARGSSPCSGPGSAHNAGPGAYPACTGVTLDVTEPDVSIAEEANDAISIVAWEGGYFLQMQPYLP